MKHISIFDMLKIGIGPSSSHTLGPWRAAQEFLAELIEQDIFDDVQQISIDLYGSLSLTGIGHATDKAVMLGLSGFDPVTVPLEKIESTIDFIQNNHTLNLNGQKLIEFSPDQIIFNREFLPYHANGMKFTAVLKSSNTYHSVFYSIGGGFITKEETTETVDLSDNDLFPYPTDTADQLLKHCNRLNLSISDVVIQNELTVRSENQIDNELKEIWNVMLDSMYTGCHSHGFLPGGLNVRRRAHDMYNRLQNPNVVYSNAQEWIQSIRKTKMHFREIMKWLSAYALAVNEVNASLGRVVTAPTNGSAGVIPAVLMYYLTIENHKASFPEIKKFLITAGVVGSIFKRNATISAAMGGCQAEIGVSSAMAAAALTELRGGSPDECLAAAEIAMEHHLGLTCDPIAGLVQIPCIERNAMGAIKACNAAELALEHHQDHRKISLDQVVQTMWETAKDMNSKYKETSEGGLAVSVKIADC